MAKKKLDDLLAPVGDDQGADYIRTRLRNRVGLELGTTMGRKTVERILRCLDKAATLERITELHQEMFDITSGSTWGFTIEALLAEFHGAWRYEGRPEVLRTDMVRAARHYAVSHTMDALLVQCGFPVVRSQEERMDDAAWYAVPPSERA